MISRSQAPSTRSAFPPRRIDILTQISGVSFEEAWSSRISREVDGRQIAFVGLRELLRNKRAAGRPKDHVDADLLDELIRRS